MKTILGIPDTHCDQHDARALALVRKVARSIEIHTLLVFGDWLDASGVSSHRKNGHERPLMDEARVAKFELKRLKEAADAKENIFLEGNHCKRVSDYLENQAPGLKGAVSTRSLLGLDQSWKFLPYGELLQIGKMMVTHDQGYSGANAHVQTQAMLGKNVLMGHNHRLAISYRGSPTGETWFGGSVGWLGDVNSPAFKYASAGQRAAWQLGFVVIHKENNGTVHVQPTPIVNYSCVVDGKLYRG